MPKVVTVFERAEEFRSEGYYVFDKYKKIMTCKYCNTRIDWVRRDTCLKHNNCTAHKEKKNAALKSGKIQYQSSVMEKFESAKKMKLERQDFVHATTKAFMASNIPLEKLDNPCIREWLETYVPGAGDLPKADTLRKNYVPKIHNEEDERTKMIVSGKKVIVFVDETTDRKGQCVFIILLKTCETEPELVVGAVQILNSATATECSRAILDCLKKYEINYDDVICVVSDSARYITKCVDSLKVLLSENLLHVQCWDHKLSLIQSQWPVFLTELNDCVSKTKLGFQNTRKRRHNYLTFLQNKYPDGSKKCLFPSPVMTRWNSWYISVKYILDYLPDLAQYFSTLEDNSSAVTYFKNLSESDITGILCQAAFLTEHFEKLSDYIVELETSKIPTSHKLYKKLEDMQNRFQLIGNGVLGDKTCNVLEKLSVLKAAAQKELFKNIGNKSLSKLNKLMLEDPARTFFKNVGDLFNVSSVVKNIVDERLHATAAKVPILRDINKFEFLAGYQAFQNVVKDAVNTQDTLDIMAILVGLKEEHISFATSAIQTLWIPPSNVDCERAFSTYNNILTDKRHNLKPSNLEIMLSVHFT